MKILLLILTTLSLAFSNQYTFLVNKYDKEIELEAKIIANIASASLKEKIKLFIPKIDELEKRVYSKYFTLSKNCENANFVLINKTVDKEKLCNKENKLFFTNNYKKLISDDKYYGAFFWNKSRPNIVFLNTRLKEKNILLPKSYDRFIEDF